MGLLDSTGTQIATYAYDAWGNVTVTSDNPIATLNPLTYRGYVYDWETELYYLQSRYYNPEWGRFINGDVYYSTMQGFVGNNMFAYCGNNPVIYADYSGENTEAADWWAATMWWLCGVDTVLPFGDIVYGLGVAVLGIYELVIADPVTIPYDNFYEEEETKDQALVITQTLETEKEKQPAVFYGVDLYGGTFNVRTPPMLFEEAVAWTVATAESGRYSNRESWGLYTLHYDDALEIAMFLSLYGPVSLDPAKGYHLAHFHTAGRYVMNISAPTFHIWYG